MAPAAPHGPLPDRRRFHTAAPGRHKPRTRFGGRLRSAPENTSFFRLPPLVWLLGGSGWRDSNPRPLDPQGELPAERVDPWSSVPTRTSRSRGTGRCRWNSVKLRGATNFLVRFLVAESSENVTCRLRRAVVRAARRNTSAAMRGFEVGRTSHHNVGNPVRAW